MTGPFVSAVVETRYGSLRVTASEQGVTSVAPVDLLGRAIAGIPTGGPAAPDVPAAALPPASRPAVDALRAGRTTLAGVDDRSLSTFQRAVMECVTAIPEGETLTYGEVADAVGRPGAARAVGGVMARNPVPFLVPCHRVVAAGGSLGGYAYGLDVKRAVLMVEGWTEGGRRSPTR